MQKTDVFYLRKTSITFHVAVVSVSTLAFYRSSQGFTFKPTHRGVLICINTLVWISWVAPSHPKVAHRATRWSIRGWQLRCSKASNAKALRCIGCIASLTSALYKAKRRGNIQRQQDSTSKHFVTWEFVWHLDSQIMSRHVTSCFVSSRLIRSSVLKGGLMHAPLPFSQVALWFGRHACRFVPICMFFGLLWVFQLHEPWSTLWFSVLNKFWVSFPGLSGVQIEDKCSLCSSRLTTVQIHRQRTQCSGS